MSAHCRVDRSKWWNISQQITFVGIELLGQLKRTTWRSRLCLEKVEWRSETDTIPAISIACLWKWNKPLHSSIPSPHCKMSKQFCWKTSNFWSDESDYRPHACVIPLIITAPWKEPKKGQTPTACEFRTHFLAARQFFAELASNLPFHRGGRYLPIYGASHLNGAGVMRRWGGNW